MEKFEMPSVRYSGSNEDIADAFAYVAGQSLDDDFYDTDNCKVTISEEKDAEGTYKHVETRVRIGSYAIEEMGWERVDVNGAFDFYDDDDFYDDESLRDALRNLRSWAVYRNEKLKEWIRGEDDE